MKKILDPIFGEDNVKVAVTCEVEIDRTTSQGKDYILPEDAVDGRGIYDAEAWTYYVTRPGEGLPGGLVGTESNSDLPEMVEAEADPEEGDRTIGGSKHIDYENSWREYQSDNNGAVKITDCSIAVTINSRTAGNFNVTDIQHHVARAANIVGEFDPITGEEILDNKISVVSMDFYNPDVIPGPDDGGGITVQTWVLIAAAIGLLLFIILLVVILLLRRKKRKKQQEEEERQRQEAEEIMRLSGLGLNVEGAEGADVMDLEMERSMELRKDIRQFVSDNPEIAAQMVKGWLRGGDDNG